MDWKEPASAVMSHGTAAVLRVLAGAEGPFGTRELARLAEVSPNRTSQAVTRLAEHGLVIIDAGTGSRRVRLNRDHLATEPVITLAFLRARVLDRLRKEVSSWSMSALHVSVFGSAARGDGGTDSDIDLLVVHEGFSSVSAQEAWDDQLARSGAAIRRWTGNWVGWFQVSDRDLGRMVATADPLVTEWRTDAITLSGPPLLSLLRRP